ncbi:hypothetical protein FRB98_006147 [Tulasnella sp. 332]|nr:hypothetical protein FRB98_006147 [Tulasnella sp. 332]
MTDYFCEIYGITIVETVPVTELGSREKVSHVIECNKHEHPMEQTEKRPSHLSLFMGDNDDYAFDDIDDADLSIINAIESKFVITSQAPQSNSGHASSMTPLLDKSRSDGEHTLRGSDVYKTEILIRALDSAFKPLAAQARPVVKFFTSSTTEEFDDTPEISVTSDGSYIIAASNSKAPGLLAKRIGPSNETSGSNAASRRGAGAWSREPEESRTRVETTTPRHSVAEKPTITSRTLKPPLSSAAPATFTSDAYVTTGSFGPSHSPDGQNQVPRPTTSRNRATHAFPSTVDTANNPLTAQLVIMQSEMEMLRKSLQDAENSKMMKDGEASNIRRLMEKQAQVHAEQVESLKKERDAKIVAALKSHDNLQSTIDGLKTQLAFKQHDMDTSSRKWNGANSARKKITQVTALQTPLRKGGTIVALDPWPGTTPKARSLLSQSQMGKHQWSPVKDPSSSRTNSLNNTEGTSNHAPQFATFYNSFTNATSPVKRRPTTGRGVEDVGSSPLRVNREEKSRMYVNGVGDSESMDHAFNDFPRVDDGDPSLNNQIDVPPDVWNVDQRQELHALLFTHSVFYHNNDPEPGLPTLQILLSSQPHNDSPMSTYLRQASSLILGAFASHPRQQDWEDLLRDIAKGLVMSVVALASLNLVSALLPILKLINLLSDVTPQAATSLLISLSDDQGKGQSLVSALVGLICYYFPPPLLNAKEQQRGEPPTVWDGERIDLANAILSIIESFSRNVIGVQADRLRAFIEEPGCLAALTDRRQPPWLVVRSIRVTLCLLSRREVLSSLFRPDGQTIAPEPTVPGMSMIPQLCRYLVLKHQHSTDAECHSITQSILMIIACGLEIEEGLTFFRESVCVVPSLVACLMQLSTPLFEEDQYLEDQDEEFQLRTIRIVYYAAHILWTIVNPSIPVVNLRTKLQSAAATDPQQFNGLLHVFIVSLGRLSFADPPEWVPPNGQDALVKVAELARDLLDTVVEGPDGDLIWEAYQPQDDENEERDALEREMAMDLEMNGDDS